MKAVLFDVYETLLTGPRLGDPETRLRRIAREFELEFPKNQALAERLDQEIRLEHQRSPEEHPEVDIRSIWRRIFPSLRDPDAFSLAAEEAIHPMSLIPGAEEFILRVHAEGNELGIISNAQAYTRTLLKRHLGASRKCFNDKLLFFSYEHRTSKPGIRLFQMAASQLTNMGIAPNETLMIGDSQENDIAPALKLGMRTLLVEGSFPTQIR